MIEKASKLLRVKQQTPRILPAASQQTHRVLQPGLSLESSFGELIWRAHLWSPFGEPIQRTTLKVDYSMDSIHQTPKKHPTIFQQAWLEPVLNLCFDKGNQSDQYLQVTYDIFQIKFAFWQEKSRKLSWILCFDS